jgi:hypothetical protein
MRPKANAKLYISAKNIVSHTNRRMHTLKAEAAKKATSQLLPKPSDNEIDTLRCKLSKYIVEHKREIGLQQYVSSSGKVQSDSPLSVTLCMQHSMVSHC